MLKILKEKSWLAVLIVSFVLLFALRIINLGYSDYNTDEATVLGHLKRTGTVFSDGYLLSQRKGPLQWVVASITFLIFKNIDHEFWFRLPFAFFNLISIYFLYQFLVLETKNKYLALGASLLVGVNGFIVAFSRFVQYQSLNLFFSFLSLYFYARYFHQENKKMSYLGAASFSASLLSHWDAVFIVPYILYVALKKFDLKVILINLIIILVLSGFFLIPFLTHLKANSGDLAYFSGRLGLKDEYNINEIRFRTKIYNPFFFSYFVVVLLAISLLFIKKYLTIWFWLLSSLIAFLTVIKVPGTHSYNLLIPAIVLAVAGYYEVSKFIPNEYKIVPIGLFMAVLCFFYYQTYILLVDHSKEYPWDRKKIFRYETSDYDHGDLTNHLIGFAHGRNWDETSRFVDGYLSRKKDGSQYTFVTNENKTIAELYMNIPYGQSDKYLAIGVKNPYNFVEDYQFSQINGKEPIEEIKDKNGRTLIKIYEVYSTQNNDENTGK